MPQLPQHAFHFADAANWESIQREGLLSPDALLRRRRFTVDVEKEVRSFRPRGITLPDGGYIRDQAPMPPAALAKSLDAGLTSRDWYDLVNSCVFFWLDETRVANHRRALRDRMQFLLTIDVAALRKTYESIMYVTPFNCGYALRKAAPRGRATFVPITRWQLDGWKYEKRDRGAAHKPAELVLMGNVPDLKKYVVSVEKIA